IIPAVQVDLDRGGPLDHVVVGDHQPVGADHEAAAARVGAVLLGLAGAARAALSGAILVIRLLLLRLLRPLLPVAGPEEELERIDAAPAAAAVGGGLL